MASKESRLMKYAPPADDRAAVARYRNNMEGGGAVEKLPTSFPGVPADEQAIAERLWDSLEPRFRTLARVDLIYCAAKLRKQILKGIVKTTRDGEEVVVDAPPAVHGQYRQYCDSLGLTPDSSLRMRSALAVLDDREERANEFQQLFEGTAEDITPPSDANNNNPGDGGKP